MDVETIQKINTLALDLMKQGLANSRDEAVAQAEKIYYKAGGSETYDSIRRNMGENSLSAGPALARSPSAADLPKEKIQEILEANTKFLVKTIKEFQEKIAQIEKDIGALRMAQTTYRQSASERNPAMEVPSVAPARTAAPASAQTPSATNHPRSGNYKEGDVSIEKFFYMGNKR